MRSLVVALALFALPLHAEPLICFGDSQTAGVGVDDPSQTFCSRMALATGRTPINRGVPGNTSRDLRARVVRDVLDEPGPACITLMIGANDGRIDPNGHYDLSGPWRGPMPPISGIAPGETQANIEWIVGVIKASGKDVTLMTPWMGRGLPNMLQIPFYADAVRAAAVDTGTPLLDAFELMERRIFATTHWNPTKGVDLLDYYATPGIFHPSGEGHREIAALCDLPQNHTACACRRP